MTSLRYVPYVPYVACVALDGNPAVITFYRTITELKEVDDFRLYNIDCSTQLASVSHNPYICMRIVVKLFFDASCTTGNILRRKFTPAHWNRSGNGKNVGSEHWTRGREVNECVPRGETIAELQWTQRHHQQQQQYHERRLHSAKRLTDFSSLINNESQTEITNPTIFAVVHHLLVSLSAALKTTDMKTQDTKLTRHEIAGRKDLIDFSWNYLGQIISKR